MVDPKPCDIVAFAAHPDDIELTCGGTLALCVRQGWSAAAVDFTRGELSSRGTVEIRREEAECAAGVLGLATRMNLGLPDGGLRDTDEARRQVVHLLRALRPRVVIAPPLDDHHPDHRAAAEILSRSLYLAGVTRYGEGGEPWRPHALLHTLGTRPAVPDIIVDISGVYELRQRAIACYRSQFFRDGAEDGPPTRISHPDFLDSLDGACRYFGSLIGVARGEAFTSALPVPVRDIVSQYSEEPWKFPLNSSP